MGVRECCRKDCTGIMSDYYNVEVGHICRDCISELDNKFGGKATLSQIKDFMGKPKDEEELDIMIFFQGVA